MDQRDQLAVAAGTELQALPGFGTVGVDGEALVAGRDELHGASHAPGGHRDPCGPRTRGLRTEGAADVARHDAHQVRIHAELLRHACLGAPHGLGGLIDGQLRAIPRAGSGEQLDGIVVLRGRGIAGVNPDRCSGEGTRCVTDPWIVHGVCLGVFSGNVGGAHLCLHAGAVEGGAGRLGGVIHNNLVGRLPRGLESLRDHDPDDLAVMPHLVGFHERRGGSSVGAGGRLDLAANVPMREDVQHPGHGARGGKVHAAYPAFRDRTGHQVSGGSVGDGFVGRVAGLAGDLGKAVHPGVRLADQ